MALQVFACRSCGRRIGLKDVPELIALDILYAHAVEHAPDCEPADNPDDLEFDEVETDAKAGEAQP